jgi:hypothetical protein
LHELLIMRTITSLFDRLVARCRPVLGALGRNRDANVTLISAMSLIPTLFGLGFCIDYARAEMLQSRINAVADAAALAATDDLFLQKDWTTIARPAAYNIFTTQVTDYQDFSYNPSTQLVINGTQTGALNLGRTVYVGWAGQSLNMFSGILGAASLSISGSSTASATEAPNMNFFLVMDKSPSMLLPTTSTGITEVQAATSDSCAFACHQQQPGTNYVKDANGKFVFIDQNFYTTGNANVGVYYLIDSSNNLYTSAGTMLGPVNNTSTSGQVTTIQYTTTTTTTKNGKTTTTNNYNNYVYGYYADGYWLTHNYLSIYPSGTKVDLRVNDETAAAQALIPYAVTQEGVNKVTYKLQYFTYDWTHPSTTSPVTQYGSMTDVASLSASSVPNLDNQDWWISNNTYNSSCCSQGDAVTETSNMLASMNTIMPAPGTGASSASPQEVMLLITDGVSDEVVNGNRTNREFNATDLAACTTIKNRGIKIAILYTVYDPAVIANDSWSVSNVTPYLPNVLPALQSCASPANDGSPLVYSVTSNQSIASALQSLFQLAITNSHLIG